MENPDPQWFCIRSKPRRQNVAAAHLRSFGLEVFNPQVRLRRATRKGPEWRTEPLFPNYVFAKFELMGCFRRVRYGFGVADIVKFGEKWPAVPEREIGELRSRFGENDALELPETIALGDTVKLTGALFHGMEATVVALLPTRQRVKVLLEFLGGLKETEVDAALVVPALPHPLAA